MSSQVFAITGLLLLAAAPSGAAANDRPEQRLQAVVACGSITPDQARLQCYDQAVREVRQALAEGELVVKESEDPRALGGVIKASGASGASSYWVELDNGDRWALLPLRMRAGPPAPGTTLKVRKNVVGTYWASAPGWPETRAKFLGRGS